MLYLDYADGSSTTAGPSNKIVENVVVSETVSTPQVVEDEVDQFLDKQDGLIQRGRDAKMCHHNQAAKCSFCLPIDVSFLFLIFLINTEFFILAVRRSLLGSTRY